ncbi:hypothetical protein C8F04DRAFT_1129475 [Mycena alexandri]|uniref:F-box domain-containing protein n=1 Tax=Mycena alexandri TaxID=1745969 RepID=A0AAD6SCV6_9AGAR|nr:hypothetical protein C8F04DRAFT_1129475 [Mycena alexandri]
MPVDDLPPEILVEIFNLAMESPSFAFGGSDLIIWISHVCRMWRRYTRFCHSLARHPHLIVGFVAPGLPIVRSLQGITYFCLNQRRVTDLDAQSLHGAVEMCSGRTSAHTRAICSSPTLHSQYDVACNLQHRGKISPASMPSRYPRILAAQMHRENKRPGASWMLNLDAPQLQSLSIAAVTPASHRAFGQLRELNVQKSGYFELSSADGPLGTPLAHFLGLEVLNIAASPLPTLPGYHPTDTCIVSLTLSDLRSADIPPRVLSHFLSTLRMPGLEHLVIERLYGRLWDEFVAWLRDPAAQYPTLRTVSFNSLGLAGIDERCLRAFTSASTLQMTFVDPWPILRILESNPQACPLLLAVDSDMGVDGKIYIHGRSDGPQEAPH